jgi:hypothetical protein
MVFVLAAVKSDFAEAWKGGIQRGVPAAAEIA